MVALAGLVLVTAIWGVTFPAIKGAVDHVDPLRFVFIRFALASLIMVPLVIIRRPNVSRALFREGALLGLLLGLTLMTQTIGLLTSSASTAGFITGTSVVMVVGIVFFATGRKPNRVEWLSVFLATAGLLLVSVNESLEVAIGDMWMVGCAIFAAAHIYRASNGPAELDTFALSTIQLVVAGLCTGLALLVQGQNFFVASEFENRNVWMALLFCAIFASVVAFTLQLWAQQYISATATALVFALEPVFATLFSAILLGEVFGWRFAFGATLILAGMTFADVLPLLRRRRA